MLLAAFNVVNAQKLQVETKCYLVEIADEPDSKSSNLKGNNQLPSSITDKFEITFFDIPSSRTNAKTVGNSKYLMVNSVEPVSSDDLRKQLEGFLQIRLIEPSPIRYPINVPNDPLASQQYYLELVNAYKAWDIQVDNSDVLIAIVDSGVELDHPDLVGNLYRNEADPINGLDDDQDGFVDNYIGWDFIGGDYQQIIPDNDPNASTSNIGHGTSVAGCASAVVDNATGVAGLGYNAKIMPLKHSADNDDRANGSGFILRAIQGIVYAANHGAHIINASYGGSTYSQIEQNIFADLSKAYGVLIVAAAGNGDTDTPSYPADYDYVLSVASTDQNDQRASFSNYGYNVDISAPGTGILTTTINSNYGQVGGTSFSSPIVAGIAALAKAKYPNYSGVQVGELLRVSADKGLINNLNDLYVEKMGRGRVDAYSALTTISPSIRYDNVMVKNSLGDLTLRAGDQATISGDFINFLWPANAVNIQIESLSEYVTVIENSFYISSISELEQVSNLDKPFVIKISELVPENFELVLRLVYTADNGYLDKQFLRILINPSSYDITTDSIATTIAGNGRIGKVEPRGDAGLGFSYLGNNYLFELGIITGVSASNIVNNVRGVTQEKYDDDFSSLIKITRKQPGAVADIEVFGSIADNTGLLNLEVEYTALAWEDPTLANFIILKYTITNTGNTNYSNFHFGLFADWDVSVGGGADKAAWNSDLNLGYIYSTASELDAGAAGIQLLSGNAKYFAINNDPNLEGDFGLYDNFTDQEKWISLSEGLQHLVAGVGEDGNDVSHTVSSGPYSLSAGNKLNLYFAVHAGPNTSRLQESAQQAITLYNGLGLALGINDDFDSAVLVYPNPSNGNWQLYLDPEYRGSKRLEIDLYNLQGNRVPVHYQLNTNGSYSLRTSCLPTGIYFLEILSSNRRSNKKLIVR